MKVKIIRLSLIATALLGALTVNQGFAMDDDAAKLEELKRAMATPGTEGMPGKKKVRTRAIVFDNEAEQGGAPSAPQAKAAPTDCASVSPDAPSRAVDFAIQFKSGSSDLSPVSEATLLEIGKILKLSDQCVIVEGHTDAIGNADKNMNLSRDRAASVVKFVADRGGVERKRLVPIGKGSTDPLKNLDPRDAKNRRVVFKVVAG